MMAEMKEIVLITGCSPGGIGFELASVLVSQSKHVLLGCRSAEKGEAAVKELRDRGLPKTFEFLEIDVGDPDSIAAAAKAVEAKHGRLDALVNNAAVGGLGRSSTGDPAEDLAMCFRTNAAGPFFVVEAFAPLLRQSITTPRIVNVSSGAGSIRRILDPNSPNYHRHREMGMTGIAYGASKAAMNLVTAKQAVVYGPEGFKVFAFSPGFIVSNLGPFNQAEQGAKPTVDGAKPMVAILAGERDEEHGCFLSETGQYQW